MFLLAALLTIFSNNAHAASSYDDVLKLTSTIKLDRKSYYESWNNTGTCGELDITNTWAKDYLTNSTTLFYNYGTINGISGNGSDAQQAMINSFKNASSWGVLQQRAYDASDAYLPSPDSDYDQSVYVFWSDSSPATVTFSDFYTGTGATGYNQHAIATTNHVAQISYYNGNLGGQQDCRVMVNYMAQNYGGEIGIGANYNNFMYNSMKVLTSSNANVLYPTGYAGPIVPDALAIDSDGDGLSLALEIKQGTLDTNVDTDGDGISDYQESQWYPDRDEVFCNRNTTPYTCAYPDPIS